MNTPIQDWLIKAEDKKAPDFKEWMMGIMKKEMKKSLDEIPEFDEDILEKSDGLFIGPRGGKWADKKHTIPWDAKKHGQKTGKEVKSRGEGDVHMIEDLKLTIQNEGALYNQIVSIQKNLVNKIASGVYDHAQASKLWAYAVDNGAKLYQKQFPGNPIDKDTRLAVARAMSNDFHDEADEGHHDEHLNKKNTKATGGSIKGKMSEAASKADDIGHGVGSAEDEEQEGATKYYESLSAKNLSSTISKLEVAAKKGEDKAGAKKLLTKAKAVQEKAAYREAKEMFKTKPEAGKRYRDGMSDADLKKVESLAAKIDNAKAKKEILDGVKAVRERMGKEGGSGKGAEGYRQAFKEYREQRPRSDGTYAHGTQKELPYAKEFGISSDDARKIVAEVKADLDKTKKSMDAPESLEDWMEKSGGLPKHEQRMGGPKSAAIGGSQDGGSLENVGRTSGTHTSGGSPDQDEDGQVKCDLPNEEKLSEDDELVDDQLKDSKKKKALEKTAKSVLPADQRDSVAHEHAAAVSQLHKSDDVFVGVDGHPMSHNQMGADDAASEMIKSETFYQGGSPCTTNVTGVIGQSVLCKSVHSGGCDETYSAALTCCPGCGAGQVGHRSTPNGAVQGGQGTVLQKSEGNPYLQRPTPEDDVIVGE